MNDILTEKNFLLMAAKWYDNPQCTDLEEFYDDVKKFNYLKRLFNKYKEGGDIKERLILNHLVVLFNVFGNKTLDMLFLKLKGYYPYLKPFLIFMQRIDNNQIIKIDNLKIHINEIVMDKNIVDILRKLNNA
jgi:hypothetical protein